MSTIDIRADEGLFAAWTDRWRQAIPALRREAQPIVWLAIGMSISFVYLYAASFTSLFRINLPLPLFVPEAIIVSVLLLTEPRKWWVYLLVYYAIQVAQGIWSNLPLAYNLSSNLANVAEPLIAAALFRRFVPLPRYVGRLRDAGIYVGAVSLGALVGAGWGASMRAFIGFPFWQSWQAWFLGDVLASLVVAPTIVLWASSGLRGLRQVSRSRAIEAMLLSVAFVGVGVFVFTLRTDDPDAAPALLYLLVPLLVWAAVRFGPQGLMTMLAIVTAMAVAGVVNDVGPFQGRSSPANVFSLQLFLLGVGTPLFLMAALVLEQRLSQTRLAHGEERYRVMVRSLPHDAVLLFGSDLRHHFADGQALARIGISSQSLTDRTPQEAFPVQVSEALEPHYKSALAGKHVSFDLEYAERHLQMDVLPIRDVSGPTGMLVIHDMTDQKRAELLTELDRAKTVFFSNISHELRTPLALVLGPLEDALAGGTLDASMLQLVHRNAVRLHRLVNALLDLSRIDAGHLIGSYQLTDVAALTADLASNFRSAVENAGLRLIVDTPPLPATMDVYIDREMWETVVLNLISNALKHTFSGEIRVSVGPSLDCQQIELRVGDTGIGIPVSDQSHIFERFYRVEGAPSRTSEGSGIGLALVHELVRLHGGDVNVDSVVGKGSTFSVRLPVGKRQIAPEHIGAPGPPPAYANHATAAVELALDVVADPQDPSMAPADGLPSDGGVRGSIGWERLGRALVVDDNADMRRYVASILREQWAVQTVADGAAALRAADENPPDVVLLDVMMHGLNGLEVLQRLRDDPSTHSIPVILLSARAGQEAAVEALSAGANDYVVKPFAGAELSARVRTQVEAARARSAAEAAVKARDEFVAVVAHDLGHPLAALNWHVQVLRRRVERGTTLSPQDVMDLLRMTEISVRTLSTQIDELRDASRLQAGRPLELQLEQIDLVELARGVIRHYAGDAEQCKVRLDTAVATLLGAWDRPHLERVLANLVSNAIKFSPNGGDIVLHLSREDGSAVLSVEDHGLGIPANDLPRIFRRYSRGSNVTGRIAGSGLGLAGAKGIVEQHGGTMTAKSTEGAGSTFVVRLPLSEH